MRMRRHRRSSTSSGCKAEVEEFLVQDIDVARPRLPSHEDEEEDRSVNDSTSLVVKANGGVSCLHVLKVNVLTNDFNMWDTRSGVQSVCSKFSIEVGIGQWVTLGCLEVNRSIAPVLHHYWWCLILSNVKMSRNEKHSHHGNFKRTRITKMIT